MSNNAVNFQKKLSTQKICGKVRAASIPDSGTLDLYEVVGIASGTKSGVTDYGEWIALTGNFAAQNLETGEQYRSGVCFLPDVGLDPILGELSAGASAVEFGWTVGIKADDDVLCGYTYFVRPIIEADESDPLERLKGKMTLIGHDGDKKGASKKKASAK